MNPTQAPQPRPWTELGFRRKASEVNNFKKEFERQVAAIATMNGNGPSSSEQQSDHAVLKQERDNAYMRWTTAEDELAKARIAPAPRSATKVQVGVEVRLKWIEHPNPMKEGTEETFIFGGPEENWEEGDVRVIACDSFLGKAVVNRKKNDEVEVRFKDRTAYAEIVELALPDQFALLSYVDEHQTVGQNAHT